MPTLGFDGERASRVDPGGDAVAAAPLAGRNRVSVVAVVVVTVVVVAVPLPVAVL